MCGHFKSLAKISVQHACSCEIIKRRISKDDLPIIVNSQHLFRREHDKFLCRKMRFTVTRSTVEKPKGQFFYPGENVFLHIRGIRNLGKLAVGIEN